MNHFNRLLAWKLTRTRVKHEGNQTDIKTTVEPAMVWVLLGMLDLIYLALAIALILDWLPRRADSDGPILVGAGVMAFILGIIVHHIVDRGAG